MRTTLFPTACLRRLSGRCLAALWLGAAAAGCMSPTQAVVAAVDPLGWEEGVEVAVENADTVTERDIALVIRSNRQFRADSLRFEIRFEAPGGARFIEEVALPVQHRRMPAPLRCVDEMPYRRRVVLGRMGTYRITLTLRQPLRGIEAAGINITKSEEPRR